jgi:ABC-2 type transport system ATP-binding protein
MTEPENKELQKEQKPIVTVEKLVQKMGKELVLDEISFSVLPGECFGIFGPRGSGKTSLLHILAGIDRFVSGDVRIFNYNIRRSERFKLQLGLLTEERSLFQDLSTGENLDFLASLKNATKEDIQRVGTAFELEDYLKTPVTLLDHGVYQRLALACALLNRPQLLLLDEPVQDFDLYSRQVILREIKKFLAAGNTCIWASSNPAFLEKMDRVGWLEDGKITVLQAEEAQEKWDQALLEAAQEITAAEEEEQAEDDDTDQEAEEEAAAEQGDAQC